MRQWLNIINETQNDTSGGYGKPSLLMKIVYLTSKKQATMGHSGITIEELVKTLKRYTEDQIRHELENPMFSHSVQKFPDKNGKTIPREYEVVSLNF